MELSTIAQQQELPLTRAERALLAAASTSLSSVSGERYEEQMKALTDARELLKQLPDKKSAERQDKSEKARMLKERLRMLKQMIPFMSPAAAKSLKVELKQIASQLASLGAGSPGGSGSLTTAAVAVTGTEQAAMPVESADADGEAVADEAASEGGTTPQEPTAAAPDRSNASGHTTENGQDRQLQETLEELKQLYRSVRNMVQRKLQQAGDRGEPAPELPPQLQAYMALPESGVGVTVKA